MDFHFSFVNEAQAGEAVLSRRRKSCAWNSNWKADNGPRQGHTEQLQLRQGFKKPQQDKHWNCEPTSSYEGEGLRASASALFQHTIIYLKEIINSAQQFSWAAWCWAS